MRCILFCGWEANTDARLFKLVFLVLAASGAILYAQGTTGNITGQVLDPSGLAVPGARVAATNLATNVATGTTSASPAGVDDAIITIGRNCTVDGQRT